MSGPLREAGNPPPLPLNDGTRPPSASGGLARAAGRALRGGEKGEWRVRRGLG